jgi:hypothetical protein
VEGDRGLAYKKVIAEELTQGRNVIGFKLRLERRRDEKNEFMKYLQS